MKYISLLFIALVLSTSCRSKSSINRDLIAQAQPVAQIISAIQHNDLEPFKSAWCQEIKNADYMHSVGEDKWTHLFEDTRSGFRNMFGDDYNLQDFNFIYLGDNEMGLIQIDYKGKRMTDIGFTVVREENQWKVSI